MTFFLSQRLEWGGGIGGNQTLYRNRSIRKIYGAISLCMNINEVRSEFFPEVRWGINRPWLGIAQTSVLYFFRFHFIIRLFIFMFIDLLIPSPSLLDDRLYGFSRPIILRPASMELTLFPLSTGNHRGFFFVYIYFTLFFLAPSCWSWKTRRRWSSIRFIWRVRMTL